MRFIINILSILLLVAFILLVAAVVLTIILAFGIGLGWILGRLFGFSLFEGAVLALMAGAIGGSAAYLFLRGDSRSTESARLSGETRNADESEYDVIPSSRFIATTGRSFQSWCEYEMSNAIYTAFQDEPKQVAFMNASQQQELAIRLAQSVAAILKSRSPRTSIVRITRAQIERQLHQAGQIPYDDGIMTMAVDAVSEELEINQEAYLHIIKLKLWNMESDWWTDTDDSA